MGNIQLSTREQEIVLDEIKKSTFLTSHFYFTGGTALSSVYLQHRESDDLDFFTKEKFDTQSIFSLLETWKQQHTFAFTSRFVEVVYICNLTFDNKATLKLDFSYYPYHQIETPLIIDGLHIDSITDIAVNKLFTISQRNEVKDFVDLYFLLEKFSIWDLMQGVKVKFGLEVEPILLASDFLKVEDFTYLPKMIKPLSLDELQAFFREEAKKLGKQFVE